MQGYVRVSPASSNVPLSWHTGKSAEKEADKKAE
jgi:hypothetical protein